MEALETETAVKNSANPSVKAKSEMENSESYPRTTERYIYNTSNSKVCTSRLYSLLGELGKLYPV